MSNAQSVIVNEVGELYRSYGFWKIARALAASIIMEQRKVNELRHFSQHMLRDIGVSENDLMWEDREVKQPMVYWLGFRP